MPYFLATAAVESWLPPTREVTSTPWMRLSASRCFWPKAPWPATQIFIGVLSELILMNSAQSEPHTRSTLPWRGRVGERSEPGWGDLTAFHNFTPPRRLRSLRSLGVDPPPPG